MYKQSKYSSRTQKLLEEDQMRVSRLREEIVARITEMSLIMARTLEVPPPSVIREFVITDGPAAESLAMSVVKTSGSKSDPVSGKVEIITWGCHCETNKVCCADPNCPPCP